MSETVPEIKIYADDIRNYRIMKCLSVYSKELRNEPPERIKRNSEEQLWRIYDTEVLNNSAAQYKFYKEKQCICKISKFIINKKKKKIFYTNSTETSKWLR